MHSRRSISALFAALLVAGAVATACGGSDDPSGTVNQPISVGTGEEEFDPSGGAAASGGETTAAEGGAEGDAAAGKDVFASAGCGSCHTLADAGAAGAVGPNLDDLKPDAALVGTTVTNGKGSMPAFKGQLSEADIANVAAYVSQATGATAGGGETTEAPAESTEAPAETTEAPAESTEAPAETTEAPAESTEAPAESTEAPAESTEAASGDAAAGKDVFTAAGCAGCHTLADAGASGAVGPNLDDLKPDQAAVASKVTSGGGGMPAYAGQLSDADIQNVAAYVSSVAGG